MNIKYKYGNGKFGCEEYYIDTLGRNEKVIKKYIQEDGISD